MISGTEKRRNTKKNKRKHRHVTYVNGAKCDAESEYGTHCGIGSDLCDLSGWGCECWCCTMEERRACQRSFLQRKAMVENAVGDVGDALE